MPNQELRHKTVAVAVVFDPNKGFLLWNNKRWGGYAFPMKQMGEGDDPVQMALEAVNDRDFPLELPRATGDPVERISVGDRSVGTQQDTYYHYYLVEVNPRMELEPEALGPDLKFLDYAGITNAVNVTSSTVEIVESLKRQEVSVALIARRTPGGPEFLLVRKPRGYFFPAVRRRAESSAEDMAVDAVRVDTGYQGPVTAEFKKEAPLVHESTRFGLSERTYVYYLCTAFDPDKPAAEDELSEHGNPKWFTVDEIKQRDDVSPDARDLLQDAIACLNDA